MKFLISEKNKVIFGWSTKCGCSHVKRLFNYLENDIVIDKVHGLKESNIGVDTKKYITIIFVRNPYKRLVSGFLDKYGKNGEFRNRWPTKEIFFRDFVDKLLKQGDWTPPHLPEQMAQQGRVFLVDHHHFTPQTTECFNKDKIIQSKCLKIYDIENIDYCYISNLYNNKNLDEIINYEEPNKRKTYDEDFNELVCDVNMDDYYLKNIDYKYLYDEDIKNKVYNFYKKDFDFLKSQGFNYDI